MSGREVYASVVALLLLFCYTLFCGHDVLFLTVYEHKRARIGTTSLISPFYKTT
jgi:hypothetical protein